MSLVASYAGFYFVGFIVSAPVASTGVRLWNTFAQATHAIPSLPTGADTVTAATLAGVIAWLLGKTIPDITKTNREGMTEVASEVKGLRNDIATEIKGLREDLKEDRHEQLMFLRESKSK